MIYCKCNAELITFREPIFCECCLATNENSRICESCKVNNHKFSEPKMIRWNDVVRLLHKEINSYNNQELERAWNFMFENNQITHIGNGNFEYTVIK